MKSVVCSVEILLRVVGVMVVVGVVVVVFWVVIVVLMVLSCVVVVVNFLGIVLRNDIYCFLCVKFVGC